MTIRDLKGKVNDLIPINTVLLSVFDKTGLDILVLSLIEMNPCIRFISTGGTYKRVEEILGDNSSRNLIDVSKYTGFPEMEGGLVKTLHPKIHAGLLGERNNSEHQTYLNRLGGDYIDLVVVNLYPFDKVISSPDSTFEKARGNIDIGGPAMLRAGAKNFPSCAVLCDPLDYPMFLSGVEENSGCTTFHERLRLAKKVFRITGVYDSMIGKFISGPEGHITLVGKNYEFSCE